MNELLRAVIEGFVRALSMLAEALVLTFNPVASGLKLSAEPKRTSESEIEERLIELTKSMERSASPMSEVEVGLKARQAAVEQLKAEAATAQQIKDLTADQQKAVSTLLRTAVAKEGNKTFWLGALVNLGFLIAGVVVTVIVG